MTTSASALADRILDWLDTRTIEESTLLKDKRLSPFERGQIEKYDEDHAMFTCDAEGWIRWKPGKMLRDGEGRTLLNSFLRELREMEKRGQVDLLVRDFDSNRVLGVRRPQ